ncbi:FAD-dependent oxidoreductase [Desulfogranum marinum]|uniref:FAD-dependent oxidoreductase n=1 Tax=Desulfogranum marinum TaxID=453220 RepID=UPI0029C99A14|nr:FAD-dependent oxidoreductase [Desulfogranum marinum]
MRKIDRDAKILILGAGAGGLSTAHYLRQYGYKNVTIFEKLGRVGGLCRSITEDNQSFDLGAAVVSPDYGEVLKMARQYRIRLEKAIGAAAFSMDNGKNETPYHRLYDYLAGGSSLIRHLRYLLLCLNYLKKRFFLRDVFRHPGWAGITAHPDLCVTFSAWLKNNHLEELSRLFEIPITTFGYGNLDEIPAPYALRYMSTRTLVAILLSSVKFSRFLPGVLLVRRFTYGFQRFWEQVAWDLNVRLNVEVKTIKRNEDGITVTYTHPIQMLGDQVSHAIDKAQFDHLIISCPLLKKEMEKMMDLTEEEAWLQSRTQFIPYAVASFEIADMVLQERVAFHLPLPPLGEPMIISQPHPDNELMAFYARLSSSNPTEADEHRLREHVERYVKAFGGKIKTDDDWHSYDAWLYFKHVSVDEFRAGYYDRWEKIQGENRTFYVGGLFDFDYVEGIVCYSRALVEQHFIKEI